MPIADYVNNALVSGVYSDIAMFSLLKPTRTTVGSAWTVGLLVLVYETPTRVIPPTTGGYPDTTAQGQHSHSAYMERFDTEGLRLVCAVGDNWSRNRVLSVTKADEEIADTTNPWTPHEDLHGGHITATEQEVVGQANQFVGCAVIGTPASPLGHVVGSDEMPAALSRVVMPSNATDKLNFTRLYGVPTSSFNRDASGRPNHVWNTFFIHPVTPEAGKPLIAWMVAGSQPVWGANPAPSRMLFAPDWHTWGQFWAPYHAQDNAAPVIAGGRVFFGGSNEESRNLGVRSVPLPAYYAAKPLCVGGGGTNLMVSSGQVQVGLPVATGSGITVTAVDRSTLAVKPPCLGPVHKMVVSDSATFGTLVGIWRLTADGAITPTGSAPNAKIKGKVWICPLPWAGSTQPSANSLLVRAALGVYDSTDPSNGIAARREQFVLGPLHTVEDPSLSSPPGDDQRRGWVPYTFDTESKSWIGDNSASNAPTTSFALGLRIRIGSQDERRNPFAFLIAFDSVVSGDADHPDVPAPVGQSVFGPEQAVVSNFTCDTNWTVLLGGELSESSADQLTPATHRTGTTALFTLWESDTKYVQVSANFAEKRLEMFIRTSTSTTSTTTLYPAGWITGNPSETTEEYCFTRGSPLLFAIVKSSAGYQLFASVGGTVVAYSEVSGMAGIKPTQIRFSDAAQLHPESACWYGGTIYPATAKSSGTVVQALQDLSFIVV